MARAWCCLWSAASPPCLALGLRDALPLGREGRENVDGGTNSPNARRWFRTACWAAALYGLRNLIASSPAGRGTAGSEAPYPSVGTRSRAPAGAAYRDRAGERVGGGPS